MVSINKYKLSKENINYLSPEVQILIDEFNCVITKITKEYDALAREYNSYIRCNSQIKTDNSIIENINVNENGNNKEEKYLNELLEIKQSFSWKLIKPVRELERIISLVKKYGIRMSLRKIISKIRDRWYKE